MKTHPNQKKILQSGKKGWINKLIDTHGEQEVFDYWYNHGNRQTAYYFGVSPGVITHCVNRYSWKRPMEKTPNILWGVARGKTNPKKYPYLTFKVPDGCFGQSNSDRTIPRYAYYLLKKDTFIGWCMLNSGYTYCDNIFGWIWGGKKMDWVETYEDLIKAMKDDKSGYFEPRHFRKVTHLYDAYLKRDPSFRYTIPVNSQKKP